jgi:agmatinase
MKIIKVPGVNGLGITKGTESAPDKIFPKGKSVEIDNGNVAEQQKQIAEIAEINSIFIGGDHSISYPLIKAISKKIPEMKLIVLDAHADCDFCAQEPTHEEWLRKLVEQGFNGKNVLLIGSRKIWQVEEDFIKEKGIIKLGIEEIDNFERIKDFTKENQVYLSIDIDFFDVEYAPATGYPEKKGASKKKGIELIKFIRQNTKLLNADLVEVNPLKRGSEKTILLAKEILSVLQKA